MKTTPSPLLKDYAKRLKENPEPYRLAFKQYDDLQKASGMDRQKPTEPEQKP